MKKIQIMGILNVTPDSFFDGCGDDFKKKSYKIHNRLESDLLKADIIDVGGESSRPGSKRISYEEEIDRISVLKNKIPLFEDKLFSIDTYKYEVARYALENGYGMINDIYAGRYDSRIFELSSDWSIPIILMHMKGDPVNMQENIRYDSIVDNIMGFFEDRVVEAKSYGICDENIILDPGISKKKKIEDNYLIIKNISKFKKLGFKVLIGLSRKSFLDIDGQIPPENRLEESVAMNSLSMINGADILRVHDVESCIKAMKVMESYIDC